MQLQQIIYIHVYTYTKNKTKHNNHYNRKTNAFTHYILWRSTTQWANMYITQSSW